MRSLGRTPTDAELQEILRGVDPRPERDDRAAGVHRADGAQPPGALARRGAAGRAVAGVRGIRQGREREDQHLGARGGHAEYGCVVRA